MEGRAFITIGAHAFPPSLLAKAYWPAAGGSLKPNALTLIRTQAHASPGHRHEPTPGSMSPKWSVSATAPLDSPLWTLHLIVSFPARWFSPFFFGLVTFHPSAVDAPLPHRPPGGGMPADESR